MNRLIDLGDLCDLYRYLRARYSASVQARPRRRFVIYADVEHVWERLLDLTRMQFLKIGEQVLDQIPQLNILDRELSLRRLFSKVGLFLQITGARKSKDDEGDTTKIVALHHAACKQMIGLYEHLREHSEADHFRLRLAASQSEHNLDADAYEQMSEEQAFLNMSARVSNAFKALDLEHRWLRLFPEAQVRFPATHLAVSCNRHDTARRMLEGPLFTAQESDLMQRRASHLAIEAGRHDLLQAALAKSNDTDAERDVYHMTPVSIAAYMGDLSILQALKNEGHDLNARDIVGRSVLTIASGSGYVEIVQYLLENGCSPAESYDLEQSRLLKRDQSVAYSALHAAAAGGHMQIAKLLLKYNAPAIYVSNDRTPSQEARSHGYDDVAKLLRDAEVEQEKQLDRAAASNNTQASFVAEFLRNTPASSETASTASVTSSPFSALPVERGSSRRGRSSHKPSSSRRPSPHLSEASLGSSSQVNSRKRRRGHDSRTSTPSPVESACVETVPKSARMNHPD